ncbi:Heparinase II/III-like [Candidatus Pelagibacterales bacterium]
MSNLNTFNLYLLSLKKSFQDRLREKKFKSSNYNVSLGGIQPHRIYESSNIFLIQDLINHDPIILNSVRKFTTNLWKITNLEENKIKKLHNFCWLPALNIKTEKELGCLIINQWINNFSNYNEKYWTLDVVTMRLIYWISSYEIIFKNSDLIFRSKVINNIVKQTKHLFKNISLVSSGVDKIKSLAALILVGNSFEQYEEYTQYGLKNLEDELGSFINKDGFVKSKNPEDLFWTLYFLVLIKEWLTLSRKQTPAFINIYINSLGICFKFLRFSNGDLPLFNGANHINTEKFYEFLESRGYEFENMENIFCGYAKIKSKKIELFIDANNPSSMLHSRNYQAGALSFELASNGIKFICNSGSGKNLGEELSYLSSSTAAHSTLTINDTSSCIFQKNALIRKYFGNSLIEKHNIFKQEFKNDKEFIQCIIAHDGYEKRFKILHERQITLFKSKNHIEGIDSLKCKSLENKNLTFSVRFHIHPDIRITKTMGNDILLSSSEGEGWIFRSPQIPTKIEKNLYFGNPDNIKESSFILLEGNIENENTNIIWHLEKAK